MGIAVVLPVGVHHSHSPGQGFLALMMICDNEIHTQRPAQRRLFHRRNSAVHRDNQSHPLPSQKPDCRLVQAVALPEPSWDVGLAIRPPFPEKVRQQAGGSDAIHIIIPKNRHTLPTLQGLGNSVPGRSHIGHQQGICQGSMTV